MSLVCTAGVVVSCKIPILTTRVRFPGGASCFHCAKIYMSLAFNCSHIAIICSKKITRRLNKYRKKKVARSGIRTHYLPVSGRALYQLRQRNMSSTSSLIVSRFVRFLFWSNTYPGFESCSRQRWTPLFRQVSNSAVNYVQALHHTGFEPKAVPLLSYEFCIAYSV